MKFRNTLLAVMASLQDDLSAEASVDRAEAILAEITKRTGETWEDPE